MTEKHCPNCGRIDCWLCENDGGKHAGIALLVVGFIACFILWGVDMRLDHRAAVAQWEACQAEGRYCGPRP